MPRIVLAELRKGDAAPLDLVEALGFAEARVRDSIRELESWGLVRVVGTKPRNGRGVTGFVYHAVEGSAN
jgi:hypothetical protein